MLLLITAAGQGSRFQQAGLHTPKPLIRVQGRTLLEHTLDSFELTRQDRLVIAVQRAHRIPDQLQQPLRQQLPGIELHWLELDQLLPGQLATAMAALEASDAADREGPLLIHNCDTGFSWQEQLRPSASAYGTMAVFPAEGDHWSFGQPDPQDPSRAVAIAEKQRISDLASIGLYGFRSCREFLNDAHQQLQGGSTVRGEHYVAPLLNAALHRGEQVLLPRVNGVRTYGTPAELCDSFAVTLPQLISDNSSS